MLLLNKFQYSILIPIYTQLSFHSQLKENYNCNVIVHFEDILIKQEKESKNDLSDFF